MEASQLDGAREACQRLEGLFERARELEERREGRAPADHLPEPLIAFALALLRMRVRPARAALEPGWLERDPLHAAVLGGTNTGKSTAVNLLLGRAAGGMRATARYSQHPEAFRPAALGDAWCEDFPSRFSGYERYRGEHPPRQSDEEMVATGWRRALGVIDPRAAAPEELAPAACDSAVLWDAPDFSTEQAQGWLDGVLDAVALAEVVLLVVTDESYADDRGLILLRLVSGAGVAVHVVANRIGSTALFADLEAKLAKGRAGGAELETARFHRLPAVEGPDPEARLAALMATEEAAELREAVGQRLAEGRARKRRALAGSMRFLEARLERALTPLREEARVAERWRAVVDRVGRTELMEAYRAEYLAVKRHPEFGQALEELARLLRVPYIGGVLGGISRGLRAPLRWLGGKIGRLITGAPEGDEALQPPERRILARLFKAWLAALRSEAQTLARAEDHPSWVRIAEQIESDAFQGPIVDEFQGAYLAYRERVDARVVEAARRLYERIQESPALLNGLRGVRLATDAAVTLTAVASYGLAPADLIWGPLAYALWDELAERGMGVYVGRQEDELKRAQLAMLSELCEEHFQVPARALFAGTLDASQLERARTDLDTLGRATRTIAEEERQ